MKSAYSAMYVLNVVFQSIFTLLFNIGVSLLISWLCVDKLNFPEITYAIVILVGVITGLISMTKFIISAMKSLEHLERARKEKRRKNEKK